MTAEKLAAGGAIGLICPSHVAEEATYRQITKTLERLGFRVKLGANIYKNTHGYLASPEERAGDLNAMVADDAVQMIFFGGGEGGNETLPYIDYAAIRQHPKIFSSYSDGTSILNAVYAKTGLVTYYGQSPGEFCDLRQHDYAQFTAHFVQGSPEPLEGNGDWRVLRRGSCDGILIGGYTQNFAWLPGGDYFRYDAQQKYLLFLEDHERFRAPVAVSAYLSHIEQSPFINRVSGLIFGHYAQDVPDDLLHRLERFGAKHGVPVVYCDDFGHGNRHAILPIGVHAALDTDTQRLRFHA